MIIDPLLQRTVNTLFELYADQQAILETKRRQILSHPDLSLPGLFLSLDRYSRGFVDLSDLQAFLLAHGRQYSLRETGYVFDRLNLKSDNQAVFQELFVFLLP